SVGNAYFTGRSPRCDAARSEDSACFPGSRAEAATGTIEVEDDEGDGGHDDREERRYDEVAAPEEPATVSDQRHRRDRGEKEHGKNGGRNMIVLDHEAPGMQVDGVVQRLDEERHGIRAGVFLG